MNTITTTHLNLNGKVGSPSVPSTGRLSKVGRRIALMLAVAGLATGAATSTAQPAEAAATTYATATICFQAPINLGYTTSWGPYNRPVYLDVWLNGKAQAMSILTPSTNGCLTAAVVPGYNWRFRVYHYEAGKYWIGQTGWQYTAAGYNYNFGTLRLSKV